MILSKMGETQMNHLREKRFYIGFKSMTLVKSRLQGGIDRGKKMLGVLLQPEPRRVPEIQHVVRLGK